MTEADRPVIVKVGGSLYDLPGLGSRLRAYLQQGGLSRRAVLVAGGGPAADAVRAFDQAQDLGEREAHWLALEAMHLGARMLALLLPGASTASGPEEFPRLCHGGMMPIILDVPRFAALDGNRPGRLPESWAVTSDSIAVRVAVVFGASRLILLKSVTIPSPTDWTQASRQGLVDSYFPTMLAQAGDLQIKAVNFRQWQP